LNRQQEAFEFYYGLGNKRSLQQVAKRFTVSETSARKWSAKNEWQKKIAERNSSVTGKVSDKVESEEVKFKINLLKGIKLGISKYFQSLQNGTQELNTGDLDKLIKNYLLLTGEATETINIKQLVCEIENVFE